MFSNTWPLRELDQDRTQQKTERLVFLSFDNEAPRQQSMSKRKDQISLRPYVQQEFCVNKFNTLEILPPKACKSLKIGSIRQKTLMTYHFTRCKYQCCGFGFPYSHDDGSKTLFTDKRVNIQNMTNREKSKIRLLHYIIITDKSRHSIEALRASKSYIS